MSILLVIGCHMLPLGPKAWQLNATAGPAGMSLFFTLSGFLICHTLWKNPDVVSFFVRRLARIMPLAFVAGSIFLLLQGKPFVFYPPHWFLYLNYDHAHITEVTSHFWSLCVELHFYLFAGMFVAMLGKRGLLLVPLLAMAVTCYRVWTGTTISIVTHLRVDEILTGVALALVWLDQLGSLGRGLRVAMVRVPLAVWALAFAVSCHPDSAWLQYLRPYLGTATVGACLLNPANHFGFLCSRPMKYIAEISYALYVIHHGFMFGWFGSGDVIEKYLKRPIGIAITFTLAHLSTFHMENRFTAWAKRVTNLRLPAAN